VKRQQEFAGHDDADLDGSESVRALLGRTLRRDIAAKREVDGLLVGADARRTSNRPLGSTVSPLTSPNAASTPCSPEPPLM
jgi:hypothetical protein